MRWVYGFHAVTQCLQTSPEDAKTLIIQIDKKDPRLDTLIELAKSFGVRMERVKQMDPAVREANHQGVALMMNDKKIGDEQSFKSFLTSLPANPVFLILDGIQDPHNLGACLRSAAAFGVTAVVWPKDKQAQITPVVHKVASGAVEQLDLFAVTNLSRAMEMMKDAGIWTVGTVLNEKAQPLSNIDLKGPIALVMGSEGEGIRQGTQKHCDYLAYIPMQHDMQSLNVSVATGVALYEIIRQRQK